MSQPSTRSPYYTVIRRGQPVDYRGVHHVRMTPAMRDLPATALKFLFDLRLNIGDNDQVVISGGTRGVSRYFGYAKTNGRVRDQLDILASDEHHFIAYTWEDDGTVTITVLPPAEVSTHPVATSAQPTADPAGIEADPGGIEASAPPPHQDAVGDPKRITMNHVKYDQEEGEEKAPTALLTPQQGLLYNALLAEGIQSKAYALKAAQALPDRTIDDFRDQVAYAAECGKNWPLHYVIDLWAKGQQYRRPPRKEATPPPAQKGSDHAAHQPRRHRARPARASDRQRARRHDQIPDNFGFDDLDFLLGITGADDGGGDVPAV